MGTVGFVLFNDGRCYTTMTEPTKLCTKHLTLRWISIFVAMFYYMRVPRQAHLIVSTCIELGYISLTGQHFCSTIKIM